MTKPFGSHFLGPAAENADLVERFLVEAFRDHVFWRRNFHPEDGPFVLEAEKRTEAFEAAQAGLRQALYSLLSRLKHGAPFFSPRYIGHMTSDTMIASLVGYFAAMLYNPNNVSGEGAPVTMALELEVGEQLARLVGYGPQAWGHLTSGGSVANLEALWVARALAYFPAAAAIAARELALPPLPVGDATLQDLDPWALMNVAPTATLDLYDALLALDSDDGRIMRRIEAGNVGALGLLDFHGVFHERMGAALPVPVVLAPTTKHYSWVKVMDLLGLGRGRLYELPPDARCRLDVAGLAEALDGLARGRTPVLALVAVLGSTETGAVDGLHELLAVRDAYAARGLTFGCHVDAAYGGYAAAMFRDPQGRWTFQAPTSAEVAASYRALPDTDSVTIDPHKLGYVHYPAGAVVFRDRRVRALVGTRAPYLFHGPEDPTRPEIGTAIVEGSKPGAAAAAVWLCHHVLPLDTSGYGALIGQTVESARALVAALTGFRSAHGFRLVSLLEPDLNVVVFVAVPPDVADLAELNRFNGALYERFHTEPRRVVFTYDFVLSKTTLDTGTHAAMLEGKLPARLLAGGGPLVVLRSAVMNPFAEGAIREGGLLGQLLETLEQEMVALLPRREGTPLEQDDRYATP